MSIYGLWIDPAAASPQAKLFESNDRIHLNVCTYNKFDLFRQNDIDALAVPAGMIGFDTIVRENIIFEKTDYGDNRLVDSSTRFVSITHKAITATPSGSCRRVCLKKASRKGVTKAGDGSNSCFSPIR
jgi:hypothetical protein